MDNKNMNEIKKALYKTNPVASFTSVCAGKCNYTARIDGYRVWFEIPVVEIGDTAFTADMPGKHLIRWINYDLTIPEMEEYTHEN